ncbi:MAG: IMP cyclohydrolase [Clostridia bacterium]|nr:IMP cyclohydrolase [Clostridia bacterium]MBO7157565.1 IMP cyclohydrolase [Clostridia bacterium]
MVSIYEYLSANPYPGRGVAIGKTADGTKAVILYFIMGRSVNSRNRIFELTDDGIRTRAFDPSKLSDPSLIIYAPVRKIGLDTVVTNGDQTDTVRDALQAGKTFADGLRTREFEPDAPNFTPRISGVLHIEGGEMSYKLSILKKSPYCDGCDRMFYEYALPANGVGHIIHTYMGDGNPIPSFCGEPVAFGVGSDLKAIADGVWSSLNEDNKVSLFARAISLENGEEETLIYNKNQ